MPVAKGSLPDPTECYLCGRPFSDTNPPTRSHVITRCWFGTPPPQDLPTLPACDGCNKDLSPREERVRNALVRMFSHDAAAHIEVFERAAGSRQRAPQEMQAGYYETAAGFLAPGTVIELPSPDDVEPVFRGITRGLFYKLRGCLIPQDVPIRSVLLQKDHADRISEKAIKLAGGVITFDNQFSFVPVMNRDNPHDGVWLYLLFNSGVVGSFTGEAAQLQFPPARLAIAHPRN